MINLENNNCFEFFKKQNSNTIDLIFIDPPFGLNETKFETLYARNKNKIISGYVEAPEDYENWCRKWIIEAKRILKDTGNILIVCSWTNEHKIKITCEEQNLILINDLIWHFNFGPYTRNKFVSSHYHILWFVKTKKYFFNTYANFNENDLDKNKKSKLYQDLKDVIILNKTCSKNKHKNINELPLPLIEKFIKYMTKPGDLVCDFFSGSGTTAIASKRLKRNFIGCEINKEIYDLAIKNIENDNKKYYQKTINGKQKSSDLINQKQPISSNLRQDIFNYFNDVFNKIKRKNVAITLTAKAYKRGFFSIRNIIENELLKKGDDQ